MRLGFFSFYGYAAIADPSGTYVGGMELQLLLLAKELEKRGHGVMFFVGDIGQKDVEECQGISFVKILSAESSGPLSKVKMLRKALREWPAELILERGSSGLSGPLCYFAHAAGCKYVFSVASDVNCLRRGRDPSLRWLSDRVFYNYALRNADAIIAQKQSQSTMIRQNFQRDSHVIPSLPLHELDGMAKTQGKKIVWISNLYPYKHADYLLELCALLPQYTFVMVGGMRDPEYYRIIKQKLAGLHNIEFRGHLPLEMIPSVLSEARVLTNTTVVAGQYEEGFPNTFIQAWSCGVPVVSLLSNPDKVLTQEHLGFCSGTVRQMAEDISQLMENDRLHGEFSHRCLSYARRQFDKDKTVQMYEKLFHQLISAQ